MAHTENNRAAPKAAGKKPAAPKAKKVLKIFKKILKKKYVYIIQAAPSASASA